MFHSYRLGVPQHYEAEQEKAPHAVFLAHKDKLVAGNDQKPWQQVIGEDFAALRKAGLEHPQMAEIEAALGVAR